jgi:hypothetical protein
MILDKESSQEISKEIGHEIRMSNQFTSKQSWSKHA